MADREKLIEILSEKISEYCRLSVIAGTTKITGVTLDAYRLADHLITNGVTFAKDTNVPSWIPVSERLPDIELVEVRAEEMDLFPCLVVKSAPQSYKKRFVTKAWYDGKGFMDTDCIWITKSVTHWMPLPEPPKEESE